MDDASSNTFVCAALCGVSSNLVKYILNDDDDGVVVERWLKQWEMSCDSTTK